MSGIELRLPNISEGMSDREMLLQLRSYLYQLIPQLQWALGNAGSSSGGTVTVVNRSSVSPSPSVSSSGSAKVTFEQLKPLIIASAEIVNAYYDEINKRLEGTYVAESDFGIFKSETSQTLTATSEAVRQNFSNTAAIISELLESNEDLVERLDGAAEDIDGIAAEIRASSAHIVSGVLEYKNGFPVYGVEIGQTNEENGEKVFSKFARFTADRLSFYDRNGFEVAYISDYRLYITDIEVTGSLAAGYFVDVVKDNGDVVTKNIYLGE